jgi:hypothetical protein
MNGGYFGLPETKMAANNGHLSPRRASVNHLWQCIAGAGQRVVRWSPCGPGSIRPRSDERAESSGWRGRPGIGRRLRRTGHRGPIADRAG